jgi:hypothetical protein
MDDSQIPMLHWNQHQPALELRAWRLIGRVSPCLLGSFARFSSKAEECRDTKKKAILRAQSAGIRAKRQPMGPFPSEQSGLVPIAGYFRWLSLLVFWMHAKLFQIDWCRGICTNMDNNRISADISHFSVNVPTTYQRHLWTLAS